MARPPAYIPVAETIERDTFTFGHGVPIASVRSLARRHGVAANTVRKALLLLIDRKKTNSKVSPSTNENESYENKLVTT